MVKYPTLKENFTIGITAPSSGVDRELHPLVEQVMDKMKAKGHSIICGDTVWTQEKAKSAPAPIRAQELQQMMSNENIDVIIPPWGGELLVEILSYVDFHAFQKKWILGYSDTSSLLLAVTLKTGMATAHGPNLIDLRGQEEDDTTRMWLSVLQTKQGEKIVQHSSSKYQKKWQHDNPTPVIFHLTEDTVWKTTSNSNVNMEGRFLGGCLDIINFLVGTPYGDVKAFQSKRINNEPIIWYFEVCDMNATDIKRSLVQMKLAGWFDNISGIMFGRTPASKPVEGYTKEDVYNELAEELDVPVIYDVDCGHVPPQITFVNGALGQVKVENGKGEIVQTFI